MSFDVGTLFAVHGIASLALGGLLVVFWLAHRGLPGLGLWTLGNTLLGASTILIGARPYLPVIIGSVLANALLFAGFAAFLNGLRTFNGRPAAWRGSALSLAAFVAVVAYIVLFTTNFHARVVVTSGVYAALSLLIVRELVSFADRRVRRIAYALAVLFLVQALSFLVRIGHVLLMPGVGDLFAGSPLTKTFLVVTIVNSILMVSCLVMLAAQRLHAELEVAVERLEAVSRSKSEFLATMSHELRTPLNAILGFSDAMRHQLFGPLRDRYRGYAEDIHGSGTHLLDLITTLLDVSKAEAGKLEVSPEELDVVRIARVVMRLVAEAAEKQGVTLHLSISDPAPRCWADERALKQILLNLLSNAIKFTPGGGRVNLRLNRADQGGILIVVADTGIGISLREIPRLLKPFEQASNAYSRSHGGTGLGLPLVDVLTRLHGGRLNIASTPGRGTEVSVWLPPAQAEASDPDGLDGRTQAEREGAPPVPAPPVRSPV